MLVAAIGGRWAFRPGLSALPFPATHSQPLADEKHYVTPGQLTATAALSRTSIPPLKATTHQKAAFSWPDMEGGIAAESLSRRPARPLVLVFIKTGCPCNVEFEPFFHRLERTYGDAVCFAGVIDAEVPTARRYAEANEVPYPILADPTLEIIRRFRAENGAYVAIVTPPGTIDSLWPGCSTEMFAQLGRRIAAAGSQRRTGRHHGPDGFAAAYPPG